MEYKVENVQPDVYLDQGGKPVRGYLVRVSLLKFAEIHDIQVPSLEPAIVEAAIEILLTNREALAQLGQ